MRMIALIAAGVVAAGPAAAQSWTEYSYPEYSFSVSFPAAPKVETMTQPGPNGRPVETRIYSVEQEHAAFKMAVIDLADSSLEEAAVIDYAIKNLARGGEVKVDIPARVSRVFGRQFSIVGADGSHSTAAVFYLKGRLYEIEGTATPPESAAVAIRFQQSLVFTGRQTNRSADAFPQRRCRGARNGAEASPPADNALASAEAGCRRGGRARVPN